MCELYAFLHCLTHDQYLYHAYLVGVATVCLAAARWRKQAEVTVSVNIRKQETPDFTSHSVHTAVAGLKKIGKDQMETWGRYTEMSLTDAWQVSKLMQCPEPGGKCTSSMRKWEQQKEENVKEHIKKNKGRSMEADETETKFIFISTDSICSQQNHLSLYWSLFLSHSTNLSVCSGSCTEISWNACPNFSFCSNFAS